ncbi:phosphatidic acid phosphatase [Chloroflexota bacterium]
MKQRAAKAISNIFSPYLIGTVLIVIASFESTASALDGLKWMLIMIALSVLPILLSSAYMVRSSQLDSLFANVRQQRVKVYVIASVLGAVGCIVLFLLKAPSLLQALFISGFLASIIFMGINFRWKISIHAAFVASLVIVPLLIYGLVALVLLALVPPVAWARMEQKRHSLAQLICGALLSASILLLVFYLFDLV